ncbi:MAG: hypothetical protein JHC95_12990 [Solirubrobacteraceae bacterium]|nr:hypothetical protein [Solirubrobacteraceae bacterium]
MRPLALFTLTAALGLAAAAPASAAPTATVQLASAPALRLKLSEPWTTVNIYPAGDVNGDGKDDVMVMVARNETLAAIMVFGGRRSTPVDLNNIGSNGYYVLNLQSAYPAGDINGDGKDDISDSRSSPDGTSSTVVIYGKATAGTIDRRTLTPQQGAVWTPDRPVDPRGTRTGDFNGDGIRDYLLDNGSDLFAAFGSATKPPSRTGPGFHIPFPYPSPGPCSSYPNQEDVQVLGDVTGDGKDDIGIGGESGSSYPATGPRNYRACVVKGKASTSDVDITRLAATGAGFSVFLGDGRFLSAVGTYAGSAARIWGVGDTNGDGTDDFAVETEQNFKYLQQGLYVFPGGPRTTDIDATKAGTPHLRLTTTAGFAEVVGVPDLTGDGRDEIAFRQPPVNVNAPYWQSTPVYAVGGRPLTGVVGVNDLGTTALKILPPAGSTESPGPTGNYYDWRTLQTVGDVDGDGKTDTAIYEASPAGPSQVETVHILYGALK